MKTFFEKNKLLKITLITYTFLIFPFGFAKSDYYFMSPGPPYQWNIEIENVETYEYDGNLYQLTVRRDEAVSYTHLTLPTNREV